MGIQSASSTPKTSFVPTGTPAELVKMGEDLSVVHSCAVTVSDGNGGMRLRGCSFAGKGGRCEKMFSGVNKRIGEFGPKSSEPGTPGEGPENVPFFLRTADGSEFESYMPCHRFLASIYPRMLAARNPQQPSGEKIRILGKAGEAQIVVTYSLPQDPKTCNKNGNNTMIDDTQVITVPKHIRPFALDPRWKERMLRDQADDSEAAASFSDDGDYGIDVASDEPEDVPAASAEPVVVEETIKRRGK